jgi:hypothetical protein
MINGKLYGCWLFLLLPAIPAWLPIVGNIIPLIILFLVFSAVQVIPDLWLGYRIMSLFALLCILTAGGFHIKSFQQLAKRLCQYILSFFVACGREALFTTHN